MKTRFALGDDSVEDLYLRDLWLVMSSEVERLFKLCDPEGYGGMQRRASVIEYSDEFTDGSLKLWDTTPPSRAGDEVFDSDAESVFSRPSRLRNLDDDVYNSETENISVDFSLPCQAYKCVGFGGALIQKKRI
ncbi:hypothetical protein TELCIR_06215 [Teladorsagia circumcincta]|uniref:Uncharacterized protein n=1 Tax=Teladorsagia circumcincta TaxID=45464 RepID=A0A2G9UNZ7_TELCI|nr:hypothetical protein TELCIR_06215 [Teladorsagia circumcincta]